MACGNEINVHLEQNFNELYLWYRKEKLHHFLRDIEISHASDIPFKVAIFRIIHIRARNNIQLAKSNVKSAQVSKNRRN